MVSCKMLKRIYSGQISSVYLIQINQMQFILKKYYKKNTQEFYREISVFCKLNHKNIISPSFIGKSSSIVFKNQGTNLSFFLKNRNLELVTLLRLFLDITKGVQALHENSIIHFDLKPSNILIDNFSVKIIDFGSCKNLGEDIKRNDYTNAFCSFEYLLGYKIAKECKDIWSLGCIFYEILTNEVLFDASLAIQTILKILKLLGSPKTSDCIDLPHINLLNVEGYKRTIRVDIFSNVQCTDTVKQEIYNLLLGMIDLDIFSRLSSDDIIRKTNHLISMCGH